MTDSEELATTSTRNAEESPRLMLTVEAAARQLSIGRSTMFALLKNGTITSVRIGRLRRVPMEALRAYAERLAAEQQADCDAA